MPRPPEAETPPEEAAPSRRFVELRFVPRIKDSIGSVFQVGEDRPPTNALEEITDNGIDARHTRKGEPATTIHVTRGDDRFGVAVFHEAGMGPDELQSLVSLGTTEGKGIGVRGMGAEAAAFYLARDMRVVTKREGEPFEWELDVKGFGDIEEEYGGKRVVDPRPAKDIAVGRVETNLTRLKLDNKDLPGGAELRRALGEKYRPLLPPSDVPVSLIRGDENHIPPRRVVDAEGHIVESFDGVVIVVTHKKKAERVVPKPIPLKEGYSEDLQVTRTAAGEPLGYWIGEFDPAQPGGSSVDNGMTVYYDGRRVRKREWFGHDSRHAALKDVVGEAHVDHVVGIKSRLMINKAQGVSTNSPEWQRVVETMHLAITPFIENLKSRPFDVDPRFPLNLETVLTAARLCADSVLGDMLQGDEVLAEMLGQAISGTSFGQRRPQSASRGDQSPSAEPLGIEGTPWDQQDGQTVPSHDVDPRIARKRKGYLSGKIEMRDLGKAATQPSVVESVGGGKEGRRLILNTSYPTLQDFFEIYRKDPDTGKYLLALFTAQEIVDHASKEIGGQNAEIANRYRDEGRYRVGQLMHQDQYLAMVRMRPDASEAKKKKKR